MVAPLVGLAVGAAARAVAKKVAQEAAKKATKTAAGKMASKAIKAPTGGAKDITTGKMKAAIKANKYKSAGAGAVNLSTKSGNIREYMSGVKVKGASRNVRDNAHRAELEAKGYSKRASVTKYPTKKLVGNADKLTTPKVPVKTANRTRSGQKAK